MKQIENGLICVICGLSFRALMHPVHPQQQLPQRMSAAEDEHSADDHDD